MSTRRGRGWRRSQRARMIHRALKTEFIKSWDPHNTNIKEKAARYCDILAPCSCPACGNQRNTGWLNEREKMTMPERKALDSFEDQNHDLESE